MKYVLASASPRRQELLTQAGFTFDVIPSAVDEKITKDIPSDVVMELAHQKALDVYESKIKDNPAYQGEDCIVIGADTIVSYRGEILGKPADNEEAFDMLSMLADRTHQVYTGVTFAGCNPWAADLTYILRKNGCHLLSGHKRGSSCLC